MAVKACKRPECRQCNTNAGPGKYWPWGLDGVSATMGRFDQYQVCTYHLKGDNNNEPGITSSPPNSFKPHVGTLAAHGG